MSQKIGMVSLGCSKNLVDTERILGLLQGAGYNITSRVQEANLLLVNTCAFIRSAQEESIQTILEMARHKEDGSCQALVVVGCLPERFGRDLSTQMPEVDAWVGVGQMGRVLEVCRSLLGGNGGSEATTLRTGANEGLRVPPRVLCTPSHYAYLKVSEGCRNRCSYCVIPSIRGDLRSRPPADLLAEAEDLAERGVKELVLIAQDLGAYGTDLDPPAPLCALLEGLCRIEDLEWIRLLYLHPAQVPAGLVEMLAGEDKICPYLDIPIQHVDDRILQAMGRRVSSAQIYALIDRLRSFVPDIALRTTLMVGFPGETEEEFSLLLDCIGKVGFDHLGAFPFSREEGTAASRMRGQVPRAVKEERLRRVMEAQAVISARNKEVLKGARQKVLIDAVNPGGSTPAKGRTSRQAPEVDGVVWVKGNGMKPGGFVEVEITEAETYDLVGKRLV